MLEEQGFFTHHSICQCLGKRTFPLTQVRPIPVGVHQKVPVTRLVKHFVLRITGYFFGASIPKSDRSTGINEINTFLQIVQNSAIKNRRVVQTFSLRCPVHPEIQELNSAPLCYSPATAAIICNSKPNFRHWQPELNRFRHVVGPDQFFARKVGNCLRYFDDSIIGTRI